MLYNAARINAIFQKFKEEECLGSYPGLPDIDKVDFTLLSQEVKSSEELSVRKSQRFHFSVSESVESFS